MTEEGFRYEGWRVVGACGIGAFFATVPLNAFGVFLPALCESFSWSREAASTAFATLTIGAAVSAPLVGRLLDRLGTRPVIVVCLAISGGAVASLSLMTSSLWHLRGVFGVIGLAMMGASPIAYSRTIFGWFDKLRGRALGLMLAGAAISGMLLPPVAQMLIRVFDWRTAWLLLGATTLMVAVPSAFLFIHERQGGGHTESEHARPAVSVRDALRSRMLWTLIAVVFGGTVATSAAVVHMVALLVDRGVPAGVAALALSAMGVASLFGRLTTGWMLDRFSPVRVSIVMLTIGAAGAFALATKHSIGVGIVSAIFIGFGSGGEADVIPYLLSRYFGLRSLSTLYGLNWTAWGLAGAAGPVLMGRAYDMTGSYSVALVELGIITLAAAGLMFTLPHPVGYIAPSAPQRS